MSTNHIELRSLLNYRQFGMTPWRGF